MNSFFLKEIQNNYKFDKLCKKMYCFLIFSMVVNNDNNFEEDLTLRESSYRITSTTYLRYLGFFKAFVLHGLTQSPQSTFILVKKISIQDFTNATVISEQEQTRVLLI